MGDTGISGVIGSVQTISCAVGAICYGAFLKGRLGGFDLPIALIGEAAGFFILTHILTVPGYYAGAVVFGFFFGIFNPALILQIVRVLPKEGATLGLSILAGAQNLCQYFSAYALAFFAPILGVAATGELAGWNVAWILGGVMAIVVLVIVIAAKAKNPALIAGTKASVAPAPKDDAAE